MTPTSQKVRGKALALNARRTALLLIDVINPFDFPGSEGLLRNALPMARPLARLRDRASRAGALAVYVNDNFGDWHVGLPELVRRCSRPAARGRSFVDCLVPRRSDYYVLKPRHSGFLSTSLDALLRQHDVETVIVTGLAAHICVLFTAMDATMRELRVVVPCDCIAAEEAVQTTRSLQHMEEVLKARVLPSSEIRFAGRPRVRGMDSTIKGASFASHR